MRLPGLATDLRFAWRQLRRAPAFATLVTVVLALGIGLNAALFALVDSVVNRSVPGLHDPARLVWLQAARDGAGWNTGISTPHFRLVERRLTTVPMLAALRDERFAIATASPDGTAHPERVEGQLVSGRYFEALGVPMALGRGIRPDEDLVPGRDAVAVISHDLWQRRFGGDAAVLGRSLRVAGRPFTIVGVTAAAFNGADHAERRDLWIPLAMGGETTASGAALLESTEFPALQLIGRLAPGVAPDDAAREATRVAVPLVNADLARGDQLARVDAPSLARGLLPRDIDRTIPLAALAFGVTTLLLLVACANVANLLLARAAARRQEIAIRLSLGVSRGRLVRQLMLESLLLAALGGAAGLLLASWLLDVLTRVVIPIPLAVSLDARGALFAVLVSGAAAVAFGLAPALHAARRERALELRATGVAADRRGRRLQSIFQVAQVAMSLALLAVAALFLRSLDTLLARDAGFDASHGVLALSVAIAPPTHDSAAASALVAALRERAAALPGVEMVAATRDAPFAGRRVFDAVALEPMDAGVAADTLRRVASIAVDPAFFAAVQLPLVRGRGFAPTDVSGAPRVAVASERLAARAWPGGDPIGRRVRLRGDSAFTTIIGVAKDAALGGPGEDASALLYRPLAQLAPLGYVSLLVRAGSDARPLAAPLRALLAELDPDLPVMRLETLASQRHASLGDLRNGSALLAGTGVLGLLLAAVGLFGIVAFAVAQRTREIGVRLALGAAGHDVVRRFVGRALRLAGIGIGVGLVLALGAGRLAAAMLAGVSPYDLPALAGASALLLAVAALAAWLPARRAARVDPVIALRGD